MVKGTVKAGHPDYSVHTRVDGSHEVGDFGLATSSLAAAVEPSELAPHTITADAEMTLGLFPTLPFGNFSLSSAQRLGPNCTLHRKCNHPKKAHETIPRRIYIVSG